MFDNFFKTVKRPVYWQLEPNYWMEPWKRKIQKNIVSKLELYLDKFVVCLKCTIFFSKKNSNAKWLKNIKKVHYWSGHISQTLPFDLLQDFKDTP